MKVISRTLLTLATAAGGVLIMSEPGVAAPGVHLVTSIRMLPHEPGVARYAVTVRPVGGPARAVTLVLGTRRPAAWTSMASGCLSSADRSTLACDLGDVRASELRTLRLAGRPDVFAAMPVVARAGAANAPSVAMSLGAARPVAMRSSKAARASAGRVSAGRAHVGRASAGVSLGGSASELRLAHRPVDVPPASPDVAAPSPEVSPEASAASAASAAPVESAEPAESAAAESPGVLPQPAGPLRPQERGVPARPGVRLARTGAPAGVPGAAARLPVVPHAPIIPHTPIVPDLPAKAPALPPGVPPSGGPLSGPVGGPMGEPPLGILPGGSAGILPGGPSGPLVSAPAALPQLAPQTPPGTGITRLDTASPAGAMQAGRTSWTTLIAIAVAGEAGLLWLVAGLTVLRRRRGRHSVVRKYRGPLVSRLLH